jgi:hypothetical protein
MVDVYIVEILLCRQVQAKVRWLGDSIKKISSNTMKLPKEHNNAKIFN